jgi:hypothetical protein
MSLRDRQIREVLDEDLKAYRQVYVRELKQARLFNESYTPPNRFERQVAFQIEKYFIEFQSYLDDIINSNQPGQIPISNGGAIINIYSELIAYIDSYQSRNPLNQRDIATIEEKFDGLIPTLSQVVNIAQEQGWRDSGVLEELYSMVEDRVYLPLKVALDRLPSRKKMLVNRLGYRVAEDRQRANQQEAFERNQAIARGADARDMRQDFKRGVLPPEYEQGDFVYVPPDMEEDEKGAPPSMKPAAATPKRRGGPKKNAYYKRFMDEIEAQAEANGTQDLIADRSVLEGKKIGPLRNLLASVSGLKKGSQEYKELLSRIEGEGPATPAEARQDEAAAEQQEGFGLPAVMRRQKSPTENIVFEIKEGGATKKKLREKKRRQKLLNRPAPTASSSDSSSESEGEYAVDAFAQQPTRNRYVGGSQRFAIRRDGGGLSGGFGMTEDEMGGLPQGLRKALVLRPVDRRPAPKHYGSVGTPEQDLSIEKRMYFLNQLDTHRVRDEDEDKDFNSISNLRKMMEKRLKKHK